MDSAVASSSGPRQQGAPVRSEKGPLPPYVPPIAIGHLVTLDGWHASSSRAAPGYDAGYDAAKNFAESNIGGAIRYVFVTDGVDGYFFSDSFGNGSIDNGIVLDGLSSLSDFSYINVLG